MRKITVMVKKAMKYNQLNPKYQKQETLIHQELTQGKQMTGKTKRQMKSKCYNSKYKSSKLIHISIKRKQEFAASGALII